MKDIKKVVVSEEGVPEEKVVWCKDKD